MGIPSGKTLELYGDITQYLLPVGSGLVALFTPGYRKEALSLGAAAAVQKLTLLFLKVMVKRARPEPHAYLLDSFPSGHTAGAFLSVGFSAVLLGKKHPATITLLFLSILTGTSRHVAKKHHPSDIAFGAAMGLTFSIAAIYLIRKITS